MAFLTPLYSKTPPPPPLVLLSLFLSSICLLRLPCGPALVVADDLRLLLKRAMRGGVCSDTDGSSSSVKPYPLCSKKTPSTASPPELPL